MIIFTYCVIPSPTLFNLAETLVDSRVALYNFLYSFLMLFFIIPYNELYFINEIALN